VEAAGLAALRKPLLPSELPPTDRELVMDVGRAMYYLYGSFLLFSDVEEGLAQLKKELEISPAHVPALVTLASEYLRAEDYHGGLPFAEKAVEIDQQSFPAHAVLGRILAEGNLDAPRGIKELELARRLAPTSPQVHMALASAYSKAGRKEEATREREEFLKLRKIADESDKAAP
jgi:tetratricopeptide (TPR) repeat protein